MENMRSALEMIAHITVIQEAAAVLMRIDLIILIALLLWLYSRDY